MNKIILHPTPAGHVAWDASTPKGRELAFLNLFKHLEQQKFYEEICLLEQPFVKEATLTVGQLVKTKIAKLGENISVARFVRFKVGDGAAAEAPAE